MTTPAPFGLFMGMQTTDFSQPLKEIAPYKFSLETPPKAHPAFSLYILQITPKCGLSWIKAIGGDINTSGYGIELKSAFEGMEEKLNKTYGTCTRNDFLMFDSIWNEPKDWMMAILKKERFLGSTWDVKSNARLTSALDSVYLNASASDTETGYITLEYILKNSAQSDAEIAEAQDDAL